MFDNIHPPRNTQKRFWYIEIIDSIFLTKITYTATFRNVSDILKLLIKYFPTYTHPATFRNVSDILKLLIKYFPTYTHPATFRNFSDTYIRSDIEIIDKIFPNIHPPSNIQKRFWYFEIIDNISRHTPSQQHSETFLILIFRYWNYWQNISQHTPTQQHSETFLIFWNYW